MDEGEADGRPVSDSSGADRFARRAAQRTHRVDEQQDGFWARHTRTGVAISLASAALGSGYCLLSWERPHRGALVAILAGVLVGSPLLLLPRVIGVLLRRAGMWFFYGWTLSIFAVVTALAVLDDGAAISGFVTLYVLALIFAGTAYPPRSVLVLGALATVCYLGVAARSTADPATILLFAGTLGLATAMCALVARNYWQTDALRRQSSTRLAALLDNAFDVVTVLDPEGTVRYVGPAVRRVVGYQPEELVGRLLLDVVHPDDVSRSREELAELAQSPPGSTRLLHARVQHRDGSTRQVETTAVNTLGDADVGGLLLTTRDVTDRRRLEDQLRHQAFHDALTGLPNRALFARRVADAVGRPAGHRPDGWQVGVLFLDLDGFKPVNDTLGHAAGDQLLVEAANRIRSCLRPDDTAARLGGDEFAVLLDGVAGELAARRIAERLAAALEQPVVLAQGTAQVGASAGIALAGPGDGVEELLHHADIAMYAAKRAGRGRFEVFHPDMRADLLDTAQLRADLPGALRRGEFTVHYQPIVALDSGATTGVEALVRWEHPERGLLGPDRFVPIAEETGLIVPLGRWVLSSAARQVAAWRQRPGCPPLTLAVNVSARQLDDPALVDDVRRALADTGLPAADLILEITESVLLDDADAVLARLRALSDLGVELAVDDFGTGYSSLAYLQRLPVDIIKIDREFVAQLGADGRDDPLIRVVVELARLLRVRTVAEGVEHPDQAERLLALDCTHAQGYHFARPLPPAQLESSLLAPAERIPAPRHRTRGDAGPVPTTPKLG